MRTTYLLKCAVIGTTIALAACSSAKKDKNPEPEKVLSEAQAGKEAERLYNEAAAELDNGHYKKAVEQFEELERVYPYAKWAIKAEIMAAYALYKDEKYDDAIAKLEQFTQLHPGNEDVPYAFYLRALSYYERIADIKRDQKITAAAKATLKELIARFPDSDYARDAKIKLDLVDDHLAGKEMEVGRFYQKQGRYIAAINRFQAVVDEYQTTSHTPEALHRLVESYLALGIEPEAIKYASTLGYNFPGSKWYERSYGLLKGKGLPEAEKSSWVKKLIPGKDSQ